MKQFPGEIIILRPKSRISAKFPGIRFRKYVRYLELHIIFPFQLLNVRARFSINRIMIVDHSDAIHLYFFPPNKAITLVHDQFAYLAAKSLIPEIRIGVLGRMYQLAINRGLRRSGKLLAVSNFTRDLLIELQFTQEISILNLTWAPWPLTEPNSIEKIVTPRKYGVLVSPNSWRKDRPFAINVVNQLRMFPQLEDLELIVVGDDLVENELSRLHSNDVNFIKFVQHVSSANLKDLYKNALFCIATSNYEGYGLPILEANALGVMCLHNLLPSFMEISSDHNIVLKNSFQENDWSEIASRVVNFTSSKDLAVQTEEKFGLEIFASRLKTEFFC